MSYRKFGKNDVLINTIKAHPRSEFFIYSSSVYYNNRTTQQGQFSGDVRMTATGFVNLYEYNIDKGTGGTAPHTTNPYIKRVYHSSLGLKHRLCTRQAFMRAQLFLYVAAPFAKSLWDT